ncbi:DeoR/GlpR family DNA-binding transcription regulator [Arthrobacter sp. zg-Y750]|uniref:DeoR/GlpR family DNA-binding transcription regulator n=1 Tax=Arthrobacter sp. zg-Y750 TaxID=2894189 RepID=UPI001E44E20F|nr:DeoR/GlpR family DNA-binding transcription regulator [Arthrobacter sp. zg-Y750]MCC9178437.1 DeoR/GlpR family DNA-binding transcription regulator [Arthrobacter sp. zg-Y750]
MEKTERLNSILDLLAARGHVQVEDVMAELKVSPATARRDLDTLAAQRLLTRTRGGATMEAVAYDLPTRYTRDDHTAQKQAIAQAASALVPKGAVIGLCGGTTSTAIAQALGMRRDLMEPSSKPTLTVVTNAINIAVQLVVRPNIRVMVTGGVVNPRSYELVGPYTDVILQRVALDLAFVGVNGLDAEVGPTVSDEGEAAVNSLMSQRASETYIVADSSKIGTRSFATLSGYVFSNLITDSGITEGEKAEFESRGTRVIVGPAKTVTGSAQRAGS